MLSVYAVLVLQWALLLLAAAYLEAVLPSAVGVKRHPLFFLGYAYSSDYASHGSGGSDKSAPQQRATVSQDHFIEPADVRAERQRSEDFIGLTPPPAVRLLGLRKVYVGSNSPPKVAVHDLSMTRVCILFY